VRALLLTLLLANLLFFGWSYLIDKPVASRAAVTRVPPLQLAPAPSASAPGSAAPGYAPGALRCSSLGPLTDPAAAAAVSTALLARNFAPHAREVQGAVADGYWVYIDNLRDGEQRARVLQRLARFGVRDAAALASSGQVSAGLFSEKGGAEVRAAAVRAAGFEPVVEARTRAAAQYWFDVQIPSDVPLPAVSALLAGVVVPELPAWSPCPPAAAAANP
jgi:hypothetical protein